MKRLVSLLVLFSFTVSTFGQDPVFKDKWIWKSPDELRALPRDNVAYTQVKSSAALSLIKLDVGNQDDKSDQYVLARAYMFAVTGEAKYRNEVIAACVKAIGTEIDSDGRTLALGRNACAYVLAAQLVDLTDHPSKDLIEAWFRRIPTQTMSGSGNQSELILTAKGRPNNWGGHAMASCAAIAVYFQDPVLFDDIQKVLHGYLGDRSAWHEKSTTLPTGFSYGDLFWQFDTHHPVGVNPLGATKLYKDINGVEALRNIDGFAPDDYRRGDNHEWPPKKTGYAWEVKQGAFTCAEILFRQGLPTYEWNDQAMRRSIEANYRMGWKAEGDDIGFLHQINLRCGTTYAVPLSITSVGKIMSFHNWTHKSPTLP